MRDVAQIFHVSLCRQASDGCWSAQATASTCEGSPKTASLGPWVPYRYVQMSCKLTWGWQSSVCFFWGFAHPTNQQTIHPSMHPCMCLFICCISLYSLSVFPSLLHVFLLSFCLPVCLSTYFHLLHWQAGVRSTFPCGPGPDKPCAWQVQLQDVFLWHRWVFKACPISGLTKRRGPSGLAPRPNRLQMAQPDKTQLHITKTSAQTAPRDWHCGKLMWLSLGLQH